MNRPRALLFDMDGVLVRSEEVWFRVVEAAGTAFRGRPITRAEFTPTFGQGTAADVAVFSLHCTTAALDKFYLENFSRFADHTWVDPDARDVLSALRDAGFGVAVVTNTMTPLAHDILAAAGLSGLPQVVACADQVARAKPAPDVVHHALAQLGRAPDEAWMTGDSRFDRLAAGAAGVRFVGYGIDGDVRVDSLRALARLVGV